ncbi:hypothetical protein BV22DRAFT_1132910 [Leucogyrophana mollusca]|uniref:Uncharacterized protein n=1 Tax=Leucogyrophana mollusca TaxID=85980 RepID=A0ACB8B4R2_9AGAM|nr:hypothetical protein BV22DRAFT_1132910 [Leucogyrophana mollusca]
MATIESAVQLLYNGNCFSGGSSVALHPPPIEFPHIVVMATVLVYDYLLTIGQEVEYVWQRPMSLMSFLYYVVRYLGLFVAMYVGSSWAVFTADGLVARFSVSGSMGKFIRGSVPVSRFPVLPPSPSNAYNVCAGFYVFGNLGFYVIISASAAIMVLRVFAMYNQSRIILGVLLLFFVPTVVTTIVSMVKIFNISSVKSGVITLDLLGTNYCATLPWSRAESLLLIYLTIPRICFDVLLVVLAVGRLVKDTVDNRMPGKWQPNVYLRMLAPDSIIYFLLNLVVTIIQLTLPLSTIPVSDPTTPEDSRVTRCDDTQLWFDYASALTVDTVPFMLAPHLIISFRHHTKADAIHSGFASHLGTSLGAGEQEMCFATPGSMSSMDERGV